MYIYEAGKSYQEYVGRPDGAVFDFADGGAYLQYYYVLHVTLADTVTAP